MAHKHEEDKFLPILGGDLEIVQNQRHTRSHHVREGKDNEERSYWIVPPTARDQYVSSAQSWCEMILSHLGFFPLNLTSLNI